MRKAELCLAAAAFPLNPYPMPQWTFRTVLMLLRINGGCNDEILKATPCPHCGARGRYKRHGSYSRWLVRIENNEVREERISLERVRCTSCRRTHALIPDEVVAHSSHSVSFCFAVLAAHLSSARVAEVCARFLISIRTLYRIGAHCVRIRIVLGLAQTIDKLQETLVEIAKNTAELSRFSSRFVPLFKTSPFTHVTLRSATQMRE